MNNRNVNICRMSESIERHSEHSEESSIHAGPGFFASLRSSLNDYL